MNKETVGEASLRLSQDQTPAEAENLSEAVHEGNEPDKGWDVQVKECIERGMEKYNGDFYVVVLNKKERLLPNVIRRYFIDRESCPTPEYDQTVFRIYKGGNLEYLWTVPDKGTCEELLYFSGDLPKELHGLKDMVVDFQQGDLDRRAISLNKEA